MTKCFCFFAGFDATHFFAHADLHDGIADKSLSEIVVFLLFKTLNVHPCTFHKNATKKRQILGVKLLKLNFDMNGYILKSTYFSENSE